jgi:hypothetical protein
MARVRLAVLDFAEGNAMQAPGGRAGMRARHVSGPRSMQLRAVPFVRKLTER